MERLTATPLPLVAVGCAVVSVLWLLGRAIGAAAVGTTTIGPAIRSIGWAPSAALLSVCGFILIDNFTYTLFTFGVGSTTGGQILASALLVIGLFVLAWRRLANWERAAQTKQKGRAAALVACGLILLSAATATRQYLLATAAPLEIAAAAPPREALPNIILFNTDGLEASHMSAYGYRRDTTPTIAKIADESLVFENALYNGGHTTASNTSILTGKLALTTGLLSSGQILTGVHAYQHLPGILGRLGYRSMYMGARAYGDPFSVNMLDGFDSASGRQLTGARQLPAIPRTIAVSYASEVYFLAQLYWRAAERLLHAAAIEPMVNPFFEVAKKSRQWDDKRRVAETLAYIKRVRGPFFAHVHLMGTHPPLRPRVKVFSSKAGDGEDDAYDNAILEFDGFVRQLLDVLERTHKLDNTLLIITSDHGRSWSHRRLPLIFRFPTGKPHGVIKRNAQLIDIAPTILDYIGVEVPRWMDGESLISGKLDDRRPIYGMTARDKGTRTSLKSVTVTIRDYVFGLETGSGKMTQTRISGHTVPLPATERPSVASMKTVLVELLRRHGYEDEYTRAVSVPPAVPQHDADPR